MVYFQQLSYTLSPDIFFPLHKWHTFSTILMFFLIYITGVSILSLNRKEHYDSPVCQERLFPWILLQFRSRDNRRLEIITLKNVNQIQNIVWNSIKCNSSLDVFCWISNAQITHTLATRFASFVKPDVCLASNFFLVETCH